MSRRIDKQIVNSCIIKLLTILISIQNCSCFLYNNFVHSYTHSIIGTYKNTNQSPNLLINK
jgi:hypothetical protein